FDALTSDRPYRPRLADEEALAIPLERRGSMYDPLVVDTFVRVYRQLAADAALARPSEAVTETKPPEVISTTSPGLAGLANLSASSDEMLTLYDLSGAISQRSTVDEKAVIIANHLRRLIPFSLCVFYVYDSVVDELEAKHAFGEIGPLVIGTKLQLGQRLSG